MSRDYDDVDRRPADQLGPLDKLFRDTNIAVLILLAVCCNGIALILGLIGMFTAKDPKAKSNATLVSIIAGILTIIGILFQVFAGGLNAIQR